MRKVIFAVMVMGVLMARPVLAQNIQVGGEQQRNTQVTETKTTEEVAGKKVEKRVSTNVGLPTVKPAPTGQYGYSGLPCKWMRK
jgi:hypothetical protein